MTDHYVYGLLSADGALLYVGRTIDPQRRRVEHVQRQPWGPEIAGMDVTGPMSKSEAVEMERDVIQAERPRYNLRLTGVPIPRPARPRPEGDSVHIGTKVPAAVAECLRLLAKANDRSVAGEIRVALSNHVRQHADAVEDVAA